MQRHVTRCSIAEIFIGWLPAPGVLRSGPLRILWFTSRLRAKSEVDSFKATTGSMAGAVTALGSTKTSPALGAGADAGDDALGLAGAVAVAAGSAMAGMVIAGKTV